MFEAKSYNDVRNTFVLANISFAACWLALVYESALTPAHSAAFQAVLVAIKVNPLLGSILTVTLASGLWGFIATFLLRLHDRLYEPYLVNWRMTYETDFILRSLCAASPRAVPEQFFERAFNDNGARARFIQRLFYKFVGDSKTPHQELLERFYTTIRNYWLLVLAEVYCIAFMIFTAFYCYFAGQSAPPYRAWAAVLLASILLRALSNRYLRNIRPITAEQVNAVLVEHQAEFEKALGTILNELNF